MNKDELSQNKTVVSIVCNHCGKSCYKCSESDPHCGDNYGLINAKFDTGYFSEVFDDLKHISFSMCEECLFELFWNFKIPPKIEDNRLSGHDGFNIEFDDSGLVSIK